MSDVEPAGDPKQTNLDTGDIVTDSFIVGDQIQQYFGVVERTNTRNFSAVNDGLAFTGEQEQELMALFVGDSPIMERLVDELDRTRVLLLIGERGLGKATTALYIAARVAMRSRLARPSLFVKPLDQNVRVELRSIASEKDFHSRVTLFIDVFEYRNRSFLTSFARFEKLEWEQLAQMLRDMDGYLIFTACPADVGPFRSRIGGHIVQHQLAALNGDLIGQGFDRKLARILIKRPDRTNRCDILLQKRREIIDTLETIPRVANFMDEFVRGDEELQPAIRKFKNVDEWFLGNVQQDFDAWCSSLTLTLAQPTSDANSIPWVDFELLRRAVAKRIKADEELFPQDAASKRDESADSPGRSFDDKPLLESSRAIIAKDPERLGDVVCFSDGTYADELWKTLFSHHRRILTHLVPSLLSMIEHESSTARVSLRVLAAQMIGRIGEIDPSRISLPLIRRWASSNDRNQRPLVGRLVQGALASSNDVYRQAALREIAMLTDRELAPSKEAARDRLVTSISAYAQIGVYEPALAMKALGFIAVERLSPAVAKIHNIWVKAETAEIHADGSAHSRVAQSFYRKRARLARVVHELTDEQAAAMIALEMAIVQLCLLGDPVSVLNAMRDWIALGGVQTGILIAVLFLQEIAADLHAPTTTAPDTNARTVASPLLISLGSSHEAAANLAAFLVDLRIAMDKARSSYELPIALEDELKESFASLLVIWARDTTDTSYRAVIELFAALAAARGEMLRRELYDLLATPPFGESDGMRKFAVDARKAFA